MIFQVIFLCGLFGYLCILILLKWWIYYATNDPADLVNSEKCAPNLIITFINMMLMKLSEVPAAGCETVYLYPGILKNVKIAINRLFSPNLAKLEDI